MKAKPSFIDVFCGCGGLSLGFTQAGYELVFGIDLDKPSIDTIKENFGDEKGILKDIREVRNDYIIKKIEENGFSKNDIDLVVGGPPCQGFSVARRNGDSLDDPRNFLYKEFIRVISAVKPKFFVMENVKGILSSKYEHLVGDIINNFEKLGYKTKFEILNSANFGVPQKRERTFFVGNRIGAEFSFPKPNGHRKVTVQDAISDLFSLEELGKNNEPLIYQAKPESDYQKTIRKDSKKLINHQPTKHAERVVERIKHVPQGGNWMDVPERLWSNNRKNRHSSAYKRLKLDEPSVTIDTGNAHSNYFHPIFHRIPTVREAARIQSFPDKFIFLGTKSNQYRQVGNAVPPLMAKGIGEKIKKCF